MPLIFWTYTESNKAASEIVISDFAYLRFSFKRFFRQKRWKILTMGEQPYPVRVNRILILNLKQLT